MTIRTIYLFLALIGMTFIFPAHAQSLPNVVLIVADDLGYGDLSCYGSSRINTPHLDRLAAQGVRLTSFYANGPECTPTRTALLTGRYQQRVGGLECAIGLGNVGRYTEAKQLSDQGKLGLPVDFSVLPRILKQQGYRTAIIGKWHLGEGEAYQPTQHGFDYALGPLGGAVDYFHHTEPIGEFLGTYMEGNHDFYRNGKPHQRAGYYMTHLITDEAVEFINRQNEQAPFFLYLPYTAPHDPYQGPDDYHENPMTMDSWQKVEGDAYTQMVAALDEGIGKILEKLADQRLTDNTVVIFFSDNGPTRWGSAEPYSGNKGHVYEGGIRVPAIVRWPGKIPAGTVSDQAFISMDITASMAAIIRANPAPPLDGVDMLSHLAASQPNYSRDLFWRKKRAQQVRSAVRSGSLKYIRDIDEGKYEEYLFDLSADPAEQQDIKAEKPEEFSRLQALLKQWEQEVQPER
ncbi:MAG: sulfatase-like hydrolase/transferase [Bacteroidota bacterium]